MSPPSLNSQAFQGRTITITTVCEGLTRKSTHAQGAGEDLKEAG